MKRTAIVVSHTHWDREWYLPFQEFRMRLVDMVDALLDLLDEEEAYRHFMMDGQTIILEDYLEVRPDRRDELERYVQQGRISIGPWYVLPDEALVSGEALVRNLMVGERAAAPFGETMTVGYLPDTFGHVNQLPQIVRGWGLKAAVVTRGVPDMPCEFLWQGADGVPVLTINLRQSYGNALYLFPGEHLAPRMRSMADDLIEHSPVSSLLFLNGVDHHFPEEEIPQAIEQLNEQLSDIDFVHGTLEQFVDAVIASEPELETYRGEMRDHKMHYLLPGVLSTRMWIKQRNATCQRLLERWAEPLSSWAHTLGAKDRRPLLRQAWRYLLQNHPHDSICGCSVDQVHEEMAPRFDWVEQIGERIVSESMEAIASQVASPAGEGAFRLFVFNSESGPRTGVVTTTVQLPMEQGSLALRDRETEEILPVEVIEQQEPSSFSFVVDSDRAFLLLAEMTEGQLVDKRILELSIEPEGEKVVLNVLAAEVGGIDPEELAAHLAELEALIRSNEYHSFHYRMRYPPQSTVRFLAQDVPAMGVKVFDVVPDGQAAERKAEESGELKIANQFFTVRADPETGTVTVTDRESGEVFEGLNRFVDGGDAGDEYNYSPPLEEDLLVSEFDAPPEITSMRSEIAETLRLSGRYRLPASLSPDRSTRSEERVDVPIVTSITLYSNVRRVDFETTIENQAEDHRLRVHFPTGMSASHAVADTAFDVFSRPVGVPEGGDDWHETPMGTYPLERFVSVQEGERGLMVVTDGLPEYEVIDGKDEDIVAITLLRCVGWLSRDDLLTRDGNAGPTKATPGAQCPGRHTFRYSLVPHTGSWEDVFLSAHQFVNPMRALETWGGEPDQTSHSLVEVNLSQVIVSAVKQPEEGEGLVIRLYNPLSDPVEVRLRIGIPFSTAQLVDLREEPLEKDEEVALFVNSGCVDMPIPSKRIVTLLLR